ncbi:MAG: GIY-YIG nuclease family protein [Patescibacteria group bacterium]
MKGDANYTKTYYLYILKCSDASYYTGITNYLERRIYEHGAGLIRGCYTHSRRPLKCVFSQDFSDVGLAIQTEKQIKGWSRKKKEALIKGDFEALKKLATCYKKKLSP